MKLIKASDVLIAIDSLNLATNNKAS